MSDLPSRISEAILRTTLALLAAGAVEVIAFNSLGVEVTCKAKVNCRFILKMLYFVWIFIESKNGYINKRQFTQTTKRFYWP